MLMKKYLKKIKKEDSREENSDEKKYIFFCIYKYYQKLPDYRRNYYLPHKK